MATKWLNKPQLAAWVRVAAIMELLPAALDSQLRRDSDLMHYEYFVLAMLSEAENRTLRMTELARQSNATLPRLSHVVKRLEERGYIERSAREDDRRATNAHLTKAGWKAVQEAAPGHVQEVRDLFIDALTPTEIRQLTEITSAVLERLDPDGSMSAVYDRYAK